MKHTLFILALLTASIQTFAQSPRIKLNQITKDSVTGSVLISSPTDSGMVYSRDLFISYGADTVLILGGDTLAATSNIISSVLSDGVTITGDGTLGNELTADTSVLATLRALSDSLALVISSVTADNVTITGDGTVGSPLKVDTATVIATKQDLDLYYLDSNPNGYTSNTGTVTSVAATAGTGISVSGSPITTSGTLTITNTAPDQTVSIAGGGINAVTGTYPSFTVTGTEVDGDASNELQTLSYNSSTNEITLSDGGGTEDLSNLDLVDSTRINATGDTAYYYQNGVLIGTGAIAGGGGGTTYNNISETADTVYISDYLDVDNNTLYVDADSNRVGIGTTSPTSKLDVRGGTINITNSGTQKLTISQEGVNTNDGFFSIGNATSGTTIFRPIFYAKGNSSDAFYNSGFVFDATDDSAADGPLAIFDARQNNTTVSNRDLFHFANGFSTIVMVVEASGEVGIGTADPAYKLDVVGDINASGTVSSAGSPLTSDIRLKKDINQITNGITKINLLNPVSYYWNDLMLDKLSESKSTTKELIKYGLVAQEVEAIMPEFVSEGQDGYKAIDYQAIITLLIASEKEQQSIIESQATEIETLKTLITELSNRLQILENN